MYSIYPSGNQIDVGDENSHVSIWVVADGGPAILKSVSDILVPCVLVSLEMWLIEEYSIGNGETFKSAQAFPRSGLLNQIKTDQLKALPVFSTCHNLAALKRPHLNLALFQQPSLIARQ